MSTEPHPLTTAQARAGHARVYRSAASSSTVRPDNPRTFEAMLRAAYQAGAARTAAVLNPAYGGPYPPTFAEWHASFLPEPEPEDTLLARFRDDDLCGCSRPDEADNPHRHTYDPAAGCPPRDCPERHPETGNPCIVTEPGHTGHRAMGRQRMQLFGAHLTANG